MLSFFCKTDGKCRTHGPLGNGVRNATQAAMIVACMAGEGGDDDERIRFE